MARSPRAGAHLDLPGLAADDERLVPEPVSAEWSRFVRAWLDRTEAPSIDEIDQLMITGVEPEDGWRTGALHLVAIRGADLPPHAIVERWQSASDDEARRALAIALARAIRTASGERLVAVKEALNALEEHERVRLLLEVPGLSFDEGQLLALLSKADPESLRELLASPATPRVRIDKDRFAEVFKTVLTRAEQSNDPVLSLFLTVDWLTQRSAPVAASAKLRRDFVEAIRATAPHVRERFASAARGHGTLSARYRGLE